MKRKGICHGCERRRDIFVKDAVKLADGTMVGVCRKCWREDYEPYYASVA